MAKKRAYTAFARREEEFSQSRPRRLLLEALDWPTFSPAPVWLDDQHCCGSVAAVTASGPINSIVID